MALLSEAESDAGEAGSDSIYHSPEFKGFFFFLIEDFMFW